MAIYLIQISLCLIIFNLAYEAFFRRDTFFARNRIYLVGSLLLTFILPFLPMPELISFIRTGVTPRIEVGVPVPVNDFYGNLAGKMSTGASQEGFSIFRILGTIYLAGVFIMLIQMFMQVVKIVKMMKNSESFLRGDTRIYLCEGSTSHFSFFRNIFINKAFIEGSSREYEQVLSHEIAHVEQGHSYDLLLAEIVCIIQWFNPFAWLYRKSLQEVHEFLADNRVLQSGCSRAEYQAVLVNQALGITVFSLSNNFNHIKLKKRIIMMSKMKSSNLVYWKTLIILPVIMLALALSGSKVSSQVSSGKDVTYTGTVIDNKTNEALPGAHVVVKGTTVGTTTDEKGMYKITTAEGNTLVASFVGYETNYFEPKKSMMIIGMTRENIKIKETTITPESYKSTKKSDQNQIKSSKNIPPPPPPPPPDTTKSGEPIFFVVEESAQFQGGDLNNFREYVFANVKYPDAAVKNGIQGKVIVQFVVNHLGMVEDVKVIRGVDPLLDLAALAAIKSSPEWKPGRQGGKAVAQLFTMPVNFNLTKDNSKEVIK
jgi:TonB family protein